MSLVECSVEWANTSEDSGDPPVSNSCVQYLKKIPTNANKFVFLRLVNQGLAIIRQGTRKAPYKYNVSSSQSEKDQQLDSHNDTPHNIHGAQKMIPYAISTTVYEIR